MTPDDQDLAASLRTGCQWIADALGDLAEATETAKGGGGLPEIALALHRIGAALERQAASSERQALAGERQAAALEGLAATLLEERENKLSAV